MKYIYTALALLVCLQINATLVSFSVDMNNYTGVINTVEINGTFNNFCGTCNPMTETTPGSGVYETTIDLEPGEIRYKFTVNATTPDEYYETLVEGSPCTFSEFGFTNRILIIESEDITMETVCFEACVACEDILPSYDVIFRVDMSDYTGPAFSSVEVNGSFNNFCGLCAPMFDDDADDVYELTITLEEGTYEYLFTLDGFVTGQEVFEDGDPCTSTIDGFVNRTIDVTADVELEDVCWNSCADCDATSLIEFEQKAFSIFPNPSSGQFMISLNSEFSNKDGRINIYSVTGRMLSSSSLMSISDRRMDLSYLNDGTYLIEVIADQYRSIETFSIQK